VAGDFLTGYGGSYTWESTGFGGVDAADPSVGVWAAKDFAPEQTGELNVCGVNGAACDFVGAFRP